MIAIPEKYALELSSPTAITSEMQHRAYLSVLEALADKANPTSVEEKYADVLITLIEAYEEKHYPVPDASPVDVLRALMDANNLRQKDLAEVLGRPESTVSALLSGERPLTRQHIEKFSERFHVSPAVFF
jgi:HTH-type transcriptional regulator/antitoxin HigA